MAEHHAAASPDDNPKPVAGEPPASKRQRQTPQQRIARLQAQLAQEKTRLHKRSRQIDAREKIVIGGAVIKVMRANENFRAQMVTLLNDHVTRDIDREAIAPWLSGTSTQQ